jgi:hypothetical protein
MAKSVLRTAGRRDNGAYWDADAPQQRPLVLARACMVKGRALSLCRVLAVD